VCLFLRVGFLVLHFVLFAFISRRTGKCGNTRLLGLTWTPCNGFIWFGEPILQQETSIHRAAWSSNNMRLANNEWNQNNVLASDFFSSGRNAWWECIDEIYKLPYFHLSQHQRRHYSFHYEISLNTCFSWNCSLRYLYDLSRLTLLVENACRFIIFICNSFYICTRLSTRPHIPPTRSLKPINGDRKWVNT